jgi:hypothetical protein
MDPGPGENMTDKDRIELDELQHDLDGMLREDKLRESKWKIINKPESSTAVITDHDGDNFSFIPDIPGGYTLALIDPINADVEKEAEDMLDNFDDVGDLCAALAASTPEMDRLLVDNIKRQHMYEIASVLRMILRVYYIKQITNMNEKMEHYDK